MTVDRAFWYNVAIMRKRDETGLSGWGRGAPGRPVAWRAVSVLGEDEAGGTVHVCEFRTETTTEHLRAPSLSVSCPSTGPFAYARPAEGVDVRISASASQESPGLHRIVTRRSPCPVCGAEPGSSPATNLVETAFAEWEWTTPAGTLHGPSCSFVRPGVRKGRHSETLSVRASSPDCSLCTAGDSDAAAFTVSELSVSEPRRAPADRPLPSRARRLGKVRGQGAFGLPRNERRRGCFEVFGVWNNSLSGNGSCSCG